MDAPHDFKPGETIELIAAELPMMPIGARFVVEPQHEAARGSSVTFKGMDGEITWRPAEYFRRIESPIRTVTRRELVPGVYGPIQLQTVHVDGVNIWQIRASGAPTICVPQQWCCRN